MTTPNQPNDERHQTNGVTERIAPSPIPPRPIPRPVASAENGQPGGQQGGGQPGGHQGGGQPGGHQGGGQPGGNQPGGNQPNAQPHEIRDQKGDFAPKQGTPDQAPGGNRQEQFDQPLRINNPVEQSAPEGGDKSASNGGQSPYQDGWSQLPQREPQSNLYRLGQAPVTGRPNSAAPVGLGGGAATRAPPPIWRQRLRARKRRW